MVRILVFFNLSFGPNLPIAPFIRQILAACTGMLEGEEGVLRSARRQEKSGTAVLA